MLRQAKRGQEKTEGKGPTGKQVQCKRQWGIKGKWG